MSDPIRLEIIFNANNRSVVADVNRSLGDTRDRLERLSATARSSTSAMRAFNTEVNRIALTQQAVLATQLNRVEQSFHRLTSAATMFSRITFYAAIAQVAGVTYALKQLGDQFLKVNEQFASLQITMKSSFGSASAARGMREELVRITASSPIPFQGLSELMRSASVIPYTRSELLRQSTSSSGYGDQNGMMRRLVAISEKMVTFRPDKTIQDAIFSLREALSGQFRSIIRRFDVPSSSFSAAIGRPMSELKADPELTFKAIEKFFGSIITPQAVQEIIRQPKMLFQNLMEQIVDIPLLRVGDAGLYKNFLTGFSNLYEDATRFMESGAFQPYALRISKAMTEALDKVTTVGGGFLDRVLHTAGQGSSDRPGVGIVERTFAAVARATEYLANKLPPILDRMGQVISELLPLFRTIVVSIAKMVDLFSAAFASHPALTLAGAGAAYAGLPMLGNVIKDRLISGGATAYARSAASGLFSAPAPNSAGSYWGDYNQPVYPNQNLVQAAPFLSTYASGRAGAYLRGARGGMPGYGGPFSAHGNPNSPIATPVTPGLAASIRAASSTQSALVAQRLAEYEAELAAGSMVAPAAGAAAGRYASFGRFAGVAGRLGAGGAALGGAAVAGGTALAEVLIPLAAAAALIYGASKIYEMASNAIDRAADKMLNSVKGGSLSGMDITNISGQANQDLASLAKAAEKEDAVRRQLGDASGFKLSPVAASFLKASTDSHYVPGSYSGIGAYTSGRTEETPGVAVGKAAFSFEDYASDTTKLASFAEKLSHLISSPALDPQHIRELAAGTYSNKDYSSPLLNASNIGDVQKLITLVNSILSERGSQRDSIVSREAALFTSTTPQLSKYVEESVQNKIMNYAVGNNKFTQADQMLAEPEWARYANLPAYVSAAQSSSYALQNYQSDTQAAAEKRVPEIAALEQVRQISLWGKDIESLSSTLNDLAQNGTGGAAQRNWAANARATVALQSKDVLSSGGPAAQESYMSTTGSMMLKLAGEAESGQLENSMLQKARESLGVITNELFSAYVTVAGSSLSMLVQEAYGGQALSDYDTKRTAVQNLLSSLTHSTGGKFGDLNALEPSIRAMFTDNTLSGGAAESNQLAAMAARQRVSGALAAPIAGQYNQESANLSGLIASQFSYSPTGAAPASESDIALAQNRVDSLKSAADYMKIINLESNQFFAANADKYKAAYNASKVGESSRALGLLTDPKAFGTTGGMGATLTDNNIQALQLSFTRLYPAIRMSAQELNAFNVLKLDSSDAADIGNLLEKYKTLAPLLDNVSDKMRAYVETLKEAAEADPANKIKQAEYYSAYNQYKPAIDQFTGQAQVYRNQVSNIQGDGYFASFNKGFSGVTEEWKATAANMQEIGKGLADSISTNFGQAWSNFTHGSENGSQAMRKFATNVMESLAQMLAQKAFQAIFGMVFSGVMGMFAPTIPAGASASTSPGRGALLMRAGGGMVTGGSGMRDDVPALLTDGEGVLNRRAMRLIGKAGLDALNNGHGVRQYANGGAVGHVPVGGFGGQTNNISITVNSSGAESAASHSPSGGKKDSRQGEEMSRQIKAAVIAIVNDQRRVGGSLRGV